MKKEQQAVSSKQKKQNKNSTKSTEEKKEKNLYFSTFVDCELHSFLIVAMKFCGRMTHAMRFIQSRIGVDRNG